MAGKCISLVTLRSNVNCNTVTSIIPKPEYFLPEVFDDSKWTQLKILLILNSHMNHFQTVLEPSSSISIVIIVLSYSNHGIVKSQNWKSHKIWSVSIAGCPPGCSQCVAPTSSSHTLQCIGQTVLPNVPACSSGYFPNPDSSMTCLS